MLTFKFNDGGRAAAGFKGEAGDCVTRAIAIATGLNYLKVYDDLHDIMRGTKKLIRGKNTSPRNGVPRLVYETYLKNLGWQFKATMGIGTGCRHHLIDGEIPEGTVICRVSKHLVTVVNGVINDTHDPSRGGTRCVYGWFWNTRASNG